ncbi:MAG: hypothetical protein IKE14_03860 [Loktanella sp.]|nr:hypothetical protein [Loktanella sp.]
MTSIQSDPSKQSVIREIEYVRAMGAVDHTLRASANLGVYEFILLLLEQGEPGLPLYATLDRVKSRYSTRSGMIKRIAELRKQGLLIERKGKKQSEVLLQPSQELVDQLLPILGIKSESQRVNYAAVTLCQIPDESEEMKISTILSADAKTAHQSLHRA